MKKRILSIVLAICLALSCIPTTVFAEDEPGDVYALLNEVLKKGGTQKLKRDYIVTRFVAPLTKSVTIDLNGHVILFQGGQFIFDDKKLTLTIRDSLAKSGTKPKHTGQFAGLPDGGVVKSTHGGTNGGCVKLSNECTFNLEEGATLYNSYASTNAPGTSSSLGDGEGGAVYVSNGCTFNMKGGTIDGCTASTYGGAVYINGGTFNMTGGTIKNCKAVDSGGAVCLYSDNSIFNMTGGTIENCKISSSSSVANSTRGFGGGVFVRRGNFTMTDGTIENCETSNNGGGVDVKTYGTFNMKGGTIKNCKATHSAGGVNTHGTFNMTGGTIDNCSAKLTGGGVCHESSASGAASFTMTDGTIKNCSAENGGGVATHQNDKDLTFTMTGGTIDNCSAKIFGGGMFIENNGDCTLDGGTIINCSADYGGGVFVKYGDFIMKSGTIENCFARTSVGSYGFGGGINIYYSTFTMTGGTVKDCASTYSDNDALCLFSNSTMIADGGSIKGTSIIYSLDSTISKIKNTSSDKYTKFYGLVENQGTISGGVFYGGIQNKYSGTVTNPYKIVTFDSNGGSSVPNQWLVNAKGATANRPTDPTWEGYKFMGWYNGNTVYDFTTAVPDNIKIFTLKAKWVNSRVSTEAELKEAINAGITSIKLVGDFKLLNTLILTNKDITLDLNGHTLTGDIKLNSNILLATAKLTLIDSNPDKGGVLNGDINLAKGTFGYISSLYANGGTVTGKVYMSSDDAIIHCTSSTPTAFKGTVDGKGEIHGGIFYGGVKTSCIEEAAVAFKNDGKLYAVEVVKYGSKAVAPVDPEKDGYLFAGWYNGSTKYDFTQTVINDITLTDKWVNEVTSEETLRAALNEGLTTIKLMADIKLSSALDLSNKNITIDLNGHVISGADISINTANGKASLTLKDSNPKATHDDSTLPLGGVVTSKISMNRIGNSYNDCVLYANGGTVTSEFNSNTNNVAIKCTSNTPTAFTGKISGYAHLYGGIYYGTITSSVTINRKKITFQNGDNTYAYEIVDSGNNTVEPISPPIKEGYNSFDGWYNGDTKYTFGSSLSEDITLTAKYKNPITYGILYYLNGGTATPANPTSYTVESEDITLNNPKKTGYTFIGWSGADLSGNNNMTVTILKGSTGLRIYVANFSQNTYTVKYDTNGGTNISDKTGVKWRGKVLDGITNPTKDGWEFTGWKYGNKTVNAYTTYNDLVTDDATASITLVAQWKAKDYTVKFNTNGGNETIKDKTGVKWTDKVLDSITNPTKDGWEFTGWKCGDKDVTANTTYSQLASSDTVTSIELTAQWEAKNYTVKFNTNGGTNINDKTGVAWTGKVLDGITNPTKDGWEFTGWKYGNEAVNADTKYNDLVTEDATESITLVAQWKDIAAPTGEISIGTDNWTDFLNTITFGLFFKDTQSVTITANDNSGEAVKIEYLLSDKALDDLEKASFTAYTEEFSINPDNKYVIYAKLTDASGNVKYINSEGIVLDATSPVISGVENGKTYCEAQTVTITEDYIKSVKLNGKPVTLDANNQFTLPAEGKQTIVVTDKAGNETSVTVTVNEGHTAGEDDGDCSTPVYCIYHPNIIVIEAKSHDFTGELLKDKTQHWHECRNEGCNQTDKRIAHSGNDDGDCTTAVICECGATVKAAETSHSWSKWTKDEGADTHTHKCQNADCKVSETESCTVGKATCKDKAVCEYCGEEYGEKNPNNHTGKLVWETTETQHKQYWDCCDAVVGNYEDHTWSDGVCSVCDYTCVHKDEDPKDHKCDICGTSLTECKDENPKDHKCDICGETLSKCKDENPKDHKCDICGETLSKCKDENPKDHKCDICGETLSKCKDENPVDHKCDICGATLSVCKDEDPIDHKCDICGEPISDSECKDENPKDHKCDTCGATLSVCKDEDPIDHKCDICGVTLTECKDEDPIDHKCDICGETLTKCKDENPKDHKCDICGETLSEHSGGEATCKDKAICEVCGEEYDEVDSSNHNLEKIPAKDATVTETGNIEYWHCLDCGKYFSDKDGKNSIELKDTVIAKLQPEIIEGMGQSITAGEKKELTFRSNAAFSDFIRVELDGKTLDEKNYTVKEGSTIVTLKADYVATLSVGEHTIGIVSENGTASTTLTVNEKTVYNNEETVNNNGNTVDNNDKTVNNNGNTVDNNEKTVNNNGNGVGNDTKSPQTGDNSHTALWLALLFVSGCFLTATGVYSKKKKRPER